MLPENAVNLKIRIKFSKTGSLKFISHLDLQRTMQSSFLRSKLPIYFSEGFSPHPKVVFTPPLSVGVSSLTEFVDVKMVSDVSAEEIMEKLNASFPKGLCALECYEPKAKFSDIKWGLYEIIFELPAEVPADICEKAKDALTKDEINVTKFSKKGEENKNPEFKMATLFGESLLKMANTASQFEQRDCFSKIQDFLKAPAADKVCLVFGLRRTGKTTLLKQLVLAMNEEEQNGSEQPKEKTSSIEERLHKRALYDSISFESELHTIFQHDNADEIWLSSPWVGDEAFMQSRLPLIQAFILQGGKVFISYSEAEEGLDRSNGKGKMVGWQSNKAINNLAKTYPGQFFYAQFTAFHSKNVIEVKNGQSILFTGSFNVLSFHVTSEHESHIRKEEMALAHYQVAENKYRDFKRQFAEVYIKRAEDSLDFLNENAILNYQNPALDYFRKDDTLAPLFTDFDDKLDELKFSIRNKKFVRKTKVRSNVTPNIQEETKEEQTKVVVSSQNHTPIDSKEDKLQKTLDMAKVHIDADLIDENAIFLKLVSLCYVSIGDNSTKVELQVPWDVELVGFLSRSDVQKLTKINVIKGREEGTTNIYVLMNNIVFRFFNLTLSRTDFFALFTRKETLQPGLQMAQPKDMSKIILEG